MKQVKITCPGCGETHIVPWTSVRVLRGEARQRSSAGVKSRDLEWAQKIKERDRRCLRCDAETGLQAAHVFTRSRRRTRWDLENGVTLCAGCHLWWAHKHPDEFLAWIETRLGAETLEALRRRSLGK